MEDIAKLIIGAWRLVHSISINADGKKEYPLGEDAIGYICYSDSGIMAVQISRKSRGEVKFLLQPAQFPRGVLASLLSFPDMPS